jgi:hypothetical protein
MLVVHGSVQFLYAMSLLMLVLLACSYSYTSVLVTAAARLSSVFIFFALA